MSDKKFKKGAEPSGASAVNKDIVVDKRNKRLQRTAVLSVVVLLAIVVVVNVILHAVVGNKWQFDWTANKAASLGEVSGQILDENDKDVMITVLAERDRYAAGSTYADVSFVPNLLDEYVDQGKGKVELRFVNPIQNPAVLTEMDPNNVHDLRENEIVISNSDFSKVKVLTYQDLLQIQEYYVTGYVAEEVITGAIRFVTAEFTPVVYLTKGHGETAVDSGFTVLKMLLEQNNYLVKEFESLTAESVPEDAEMLLMLAPTADLAAGEIKVYMDFLKSGGSLFVMADYATSEMKNLNELLREFNLRITTDRVQENDSNKFFSGDPLSFVAEMPVSKLFSQTNVVNYSVVVNSRFITTADNSKDWIETQPILQTGDQGTRQIAGDEANQSQPAVQTLAMFSENRGFIDGSSVTKPAKVAVFGSAVSFSDNVLLTYMQNAGNYLLANSAMSYMSNLEENADQPLLIQPKEIVSYSISPQSQGSTQIASIFFMVVLPLALGVVALMVYRRRKSL